jgi:hypothetical protein
MEVTMVAKRKGSLASQMMTAGAYQFAGQYSSGLNLANGLTLVTSYTASGETLLAWSRMQMQFGTGNSPVFVSLVCVRRYAADAAFDMTSEQIEQLRRDGKLFFLKHIWVPSKAVVGYQSKFETEFRNVKLRDTEMLVWYIWNWSAAIAAGAREQLFVHEYREVKV